jgi:hypothetical protein
LIATAVFIAAVAAMPGLPGRTEEVRPSATADESTSIDDRIVFAAKRDGNWDIYSTRADGTEMVRLTTLAR